MVKQLAIATVGTMVMIGAAGAQAVGADGTPPGHWAPIVQTQTPPAPAKTFGMDLQLQSQFSSVRRQATALADRMPAADYGFSPAPAMRTFGAGIVHIAASNFSYCANLTGLTPPHKGEDLEKTVTEKTAIAHLLAESFDFCAPFAKTLTPETMMATYNATGIAPDGTKSSIGVARGGLLSQMLMHNTEMYGYLSVYLRMKGLVPPSSDPAPGKGRGGAGR